MNLITKILIVLALIAVGLGTFFVTKFVYDKPIQIYKGKTDTVTVTKTRVIRVPEIRTVAKIDTIYIYIDGQPHEQKFAVSDTVIDVNGDTVKLENRYFFPPENAFYNKVDLITHPKELIINTTDTLIKYVQLPFKANLFEFGLMADAQYPPFNFNLGTYLGMNIERNHFWLRAGGRIADNIIKTVYSAGLRYVLF